MTAKGSGVVPVLLSSLDGLEPEAVVLSLEIIERLGDATMTHRLIDRDRSIRKMPIAYFHPWEFDRSRERMESGALHRPNLQGWRPAA